MSELIKAVQTALKQAGFNPGDIDGDNGRDTQRALAAFQTARALPIKFPGTLGPTTYKALDIYPKAFETNDARLGLPIAPPWIIEARRLIGLNEIRNNQELRAYLKTGGSIGDPAKVPWCGDFVQTTILKTLPHEAVPSNPFYALNWSSWGRSVGSLDAPALGAVGTKERFERGRLVGGHVFYIVGHDADNVHALGGNQSNGVSVVKIPKAAIKAMRWPITYDLPRAFLPETTLNASISTNEA